jgi:hypothetical protein
VRVCMTACMYSHAQVRHTRILRYKNPWMSNCERVCLLCHRRIHVRSRVRGDDTALRCLYQAIHGTHTSIVSIYMINADIYIHAYIYIEERITDACVRHRRAHVCVGVCARGSVWVWAPRYLRRKRASPLRRRGRRAARLAGVPPGVGVQREHRRVEHRVGHLVVRGMRRFRPRAARHRGGMRSAFLRCGAAAVRGGTADARACARTHV